MKKIWEKSPLCSFQTKFAIHMNFCNFTNYTVDKMVWYINIFVSMTFAPGAIVSCLGRFAVLVKYKIESNLKDKELYIKKIPPDKKTRTFVGHTCQLSRRTFISLTNRSTQKTTYDLKTNTLTIQRRSQHKTHKHI